MVYKERTRECARCGGQVKGRIPVNGDVFCLTCNLDNAKEAALQLANKSGPYYDRWLATRGPQGRPRTKQK